MATLKSNVPILLTLLLAVVVTLAGCSNNNSGEARAFVKRVRSEKPGPIKPAPKIKAYKPFTYHANGRRQPFQPIHQKKQHAVPTGPKPNPNRPRGPLEHYSLGSLTMMGTMTADSVTYALIKVPSGSIYRVKAGQYLGEHSGKIIRISSTGLIMREIVPKSGGGYKKKRTTMTVGQSG